MIRKEKSRTISNLIKRKNKATFAKDISQPVIDSACSKTTLLHLAALYNNGDLIQNLLNVKCDVNAKDSAGKTPLLIAAINNNSEAMKMLLKNNTDVLIADNEGQSPMQVLLRKIKHVCQPVIVDFFEKFKTSALSYEEMLKLFVETGCPLEIVVLMNNPQVMQELLENRKIISMYESDLAMNIVFNINDNLESVRVLLQCGCQKELGKYRFLEYFVSSMCSPGENLTVAESYVKILVNWDIISEKELDYFNKIFVIGSEDAVRMLMRCNIHEYAMDKFGINLLASLFDNLHLNAIEIIKNIDFCVNMPYKFGRTALHFAAIRNSSRNIEFLLNMGADPNAPDSQGLTPLFCTSDVYCIKILWRRGADIQKIVNIRGTNNFLLRKLPVIAYLAIIEGKGLEIKSKIRDEIESSRIYSQCYEKCKRQIGWMKNQIVFGDFTLFDALDDERVDELTRYVKTKSTVETILRGIKESVMVVQYYYSIIEENCNKALRLRDFRNKIALVISESTGIVNSDHLVVEKIVNFLSYKDL